MNIKIIPTLIGTDVENLRFALTKTPDAVVVYVYNGARLVTCELWLKVFDQKDLLSVVFNVY